MKSKPYHYLALIMLLFYGCGAKQTASTTKPIDLVIQNSWFVAGPTLENQENINLIRVKKKVINVIANSNPIGEIELNVMVTPSSSNDGKPTNLPDSSNYLSITYQSSQEIKLQAREGNTEGTGCVHGGSHPRVNLPASSKSFSTIQIKWSDFKQDELPNGKRLDIHNICKLNFVNYHPIAGATLQIRSITIENFN
ncbi:hypothetical protein ACRASX_01255 [Flavobacterium sp. TMP13]|uniref:hypothetical protein n=1 Tax=Flavobacterium sp. TMP13 TaxID=3425950 RepID=UPI003D78A3A6